MEEKYKKIGKAVAVVLVPTIILIILLICVYFWKRRKKNKTEKQALELSVEKIDIPYTGLRIVKPDKPDELGESEEKPKGADPKGPKGISGENIIVVEKDKVNPEITKIA